MKKNISLSSKHLLMNLMLMTMISTKKQEFFPRLSIISTQFYHNLHYYLIFWMSKIKIKSSFFFKINNFLF